MNCPGAVTCSGSELETVSCDVRVSKCYKTLIDSLLTEGFFTKNPMIILNKKPIKKHLAETAETRT